MSRNFTKVIFGTLIVLFNLLSFGQETDNWYFGSPTVPNAGLRISFTSGTAVVTRGYPIATEEGSSSISDASGTPLFYTDGTKIWDASTNATFGTGLLGGSSSTQSAIIVPKPGATNQWLVFTSGQTGLNGINYYTVSGTPGAFTISTATNLCAANTVGEGLFITGSSKVGSTHWLIARDLGSTGQVRAWDISNAGVVTATPVLSTLSGTSFTNTNYTSKIGTIKANSCQTKLAFSYLNSDVDITGFNDATGQVTNTAVRITLADRFMPRPSNAGSYGLEFSPNDDYLYITNLADRQLFQYNIATNALVEIAAIASASPSGTKDETGQLQAGPDGKIYMAINGEATSGTAYIGVINAPNLAACNFVANGLQITLNANPDGYCFRGLPTFPKSLVITEPVLGPGSGTYCVNTAIPLSFSFAGAINASTIVWSATGGGATFSPSNTVASPSVTFSTTGAKTVTVTFNDECGRSYTKTGNFTINNIASTTGTISCGANCITLTSPSSNAIWYDAATGGRIIGTGTSNTLCYAADSYVPSTLWVEEGASATSTGNTNRTIGPGTLAGAAEASPYGPVTFDALADVLTIKSFVVKTWSGTGNFDVEIRNSANTVVYLKTFSIPTAGVDYTVNLNATFPEATGYQIRFINTTHQWYRTTWAGATNTNEMSLPGGALGPGGQYSLANFIYDYKNFTVTTTCATRTAVNKTCMLPVEYLYLNGKASGKDVILDWATASEINNDYFDVQRSYDGNFFQSIGKVGGAGNSNAVRTYSFTDRNVAGTFAYYRLVQHDFDGEQSPSDVVRVNLVGAAIAQVAPNPSRDDFEIKLLNGESSFELLIVDVTGKEVLNTTVGAGSTRIGSDLTPGTYFVKVVSGQSVYHTSIIKF